MDNKEFLKIFKDVGSEEVNDHVGWIDTGSYILNAAVSTSIYGGLSDNAISVFHAKEAVGKTYYAMSAVKKFLEDHPDGFCFFMDTEGATRSETFAMRGIDFDRVIRREPETIEQTQTMIYKFLTNYKNSESKRPILAVLDSYGMLPSSKERADAESGKEVRDMTKQTAGRSLFRTITSDLRKLQIPFIVNGHSYTDIMSYGAPQVLQGGGGLRYAASTILYLSKSKDKEELKQAGKVVKTHVGNIITVEVQKSRFSREGRKVETKLSFTDGIDRYYGLIDLAAQYNIVKKVSTQYEFPDGSKHFKKHIDAEPEKFWNAELLGKVEEAAKLHFSLGSGDIAYESVVEEDEEVINSEE